MEKHKKKERTRIEIRVTKLEKKLIQKKAEKAGLTVSDYIRRASLRRELNYRLTDEEIECYKELSRFRSNFVRIGNFMKAQHPKTNILVERLADELKTHLSKLQ